MRNNNLTFKEILAREETKQHEKAYLNEKSKVMSFDEFVKSLKGGKLS